MDDDRDFEGWLKAEAEGRDDEADAAFGAIFKASPRPIPSSAFAAKTMTAVAAASERDARRAHLLRRVGIPAAAAVAIVLAWLSSGLLMAGFSAVIVRTLDLLIGAIVYVATTTRTGGDVWTLAGSLGRATAALLTSPSVTTTILVLQAMAALALIALQRLLRSDRESL